MNRLEQCVSYHTIEEVEAEALFESTTRNLVTTIAMMLNLRCGIDVALDNFGKFVQTITAKKNLHDTAGITDQTITEEERMDEEPGDNEHLLSEEEINFKREVTEAIHKTLHKKERRRVYQSKSLDIILYRKRLKIRTSDFLSNDDLKKANI